MNPSRQKGDRFERECVHACNDAGVPAERVPLSGATKGGDYEHDLRVSVLGRRETVECKHYKRWLGKFYGWLAKGPRYLFVKEDRGETLVVMRLSDFFYLAKGGEPSPEEATQVAISGEDPWSV